MGTVLSSRQGDIFIELRHAPAVTDAPYPLSDVGGARVLGL